jgi:transcriptional regulator with XRE-family HTH domain
MNNRMTAQERLKKWRNKQGFSIHAAAEKLGCTGQSVSNWEKGAIPGREMRLRIRSEVGIPTMAWSKEEP